ncbi:uncharacterized protein LOC110942054 [Helianthus annuus]|uniref:uncharacterized protein LOC110942054 n=1 Tax=Helianthus annuus TaxID=4232 RepID=UPI000B9017E4|nr:uncharacterized protein LOC110942054 [Helianthus annuus]
MESLSVLWMIFPLALFLPSSNLYAAHSILILMMKMKIGGSLTNRQHFMYSFVAAPVNLLPSRHIWLVAKSLRGGDSGAYIVASRLAIATAPPAYVFSSHWLAGELVFPYIDQFKLCFIIRFSYGLI